jgi:predicted transcriptional regulator
MEKTTAIKLAGSQTALASLLGISQAAISQWGDRVPENRVWQLKVLKPEWFKDFSQTVSMN